jgi:uncharacterized protein (DUF2147 family)
MRINALALQAAALAAVLISTGAARAEEAPFGVWMDHTGRGAVRISDCDGRLCGHVAWVKDAKDAEGCGEQIIGDVKPIGGNTWDNGWIWDPDRGEKFDVEIKPVSQNKLRVMGYAGIKWLSETMTWQRAASDLQTCDKPATEAKAKPDTEKPATAATAVDDTSTDRKAAVAKPEVEAPKATAKYDDETYVNEREEQASISDDADEDPAPKGKKAKRFIAKIAEAMDKSDFGSRSGGTCRVNVPYVDMVVKFPCDGKDD